jgi:hypothetical protein
MEMVAEQCYGMLGARPLLGRLIADQTSATAGDEPVTVISHDFWQREFGGDPAAIGRSLRLEGITLTVIGVTPPQSPTFGGFGSQDDASHPRVAMISASLARQLFPDGHALGKRLRVGLPPKVADVEVLGIVRDASPGDVRISRLPIVYQPIFQQPMYLQVPVALIRTENPQAVREPVRRAIASLDHHYPFNLYTLQDSIDRSLISERALLLLSSLVADPARRVAGIEPAVASRDGGGFARALARADGVLGDDAGGVTEGGQLARREVAVAAEWEPGIGDRADARAAQAEDAVADRFKHLAHLAIAAFVDGHLDDRVIASCIRNHGDQSRLAGCRALAIDHDAAGEAGKRASLGHAGDPRFVHPLDFVSRVRHARRQLAVVGEQQQSL